MYGRFVISRGFRRIQFETLETRQNVSRRWRKYLVIFFLLKYCETSFDGWQLRHVNLLTIKNWEFQWYTNNRSNSYVEDGILKIRPTLTSVDYDVNFLTSGTIDLNGALPTDTYVSCKILTIEIKLNCKLFFALLFFFFVLI